MHATVCLLNRGCDSMSHAVCICCRLVCVLNSLLCTVGLQPTHCTCPASSRAALVGAKDESDASHSTSREQDTSRCQTIRDDMMEEEEFTEAERKETEKERRSASGRGMQGTERKRRSIGAKAVGESLLLRAMCSPHRCRCVGLGLSLGGLSLSLRFACSPSLPGVLERPKRVVFVSKLFC